MDRLVALAVNRRYLMVAMFIAVFIGGLFAFQHLNIEAYPDPTPPMVDIVTQSPGLSAEEIERYITIPIETQVAGIKNLKTIRTISLYGLSDVKLQFSFDYTYDEAQQQVLNRLSQLAPLPGNVQPGISPLSPIGEIFRYRLKGPPNYSVLDLKTLQDWVLQRRFRAVPGVIDVTGWGGKLPAGRGRGVSLQFVFGSYLALIAEVEVAKDGSVRVHRVVCAMDCGTVVNPDTVQAQLQSGINFGVTAALYGEITLKDGRVEQTNFDSYQMLRIDQAPAIEVHIVPSTEPPGGMGETGTSGIVPAISNAIFAATGKRLRKMPVDPAVLKQA